ncbi:MAG TPA: hypothetical protein ENF73_05845, partial [Proteobacteria bacterium]|nr:hypothetical protein [Pseudomonadota bacterium]
MSYRGVVRAVSVGAARLLIFAYPTLLHLAFFSWMRSALFYGVWRYWLLIPMVFAIEIWLFLKQSEKRFDWRGALFVPLRAAALAFPIFVIVLSISNKAYWPIKVQFFLGMAYDSVGSASVFAAGLFVVLLLCFFLYERVSRFRAFFSLYLPMGVVLMVVALNAPSGRSRIDLESRVVFRHSDAKSVCPVSGLLTQLTFHTSRATDIHIDGLDFYVSYRNPFSFSPKQISALVFKGAAGELACLYATGIRGVSSHSGLASLYYATAAPRPTVSRLSKVDLETELVLNPSFVKLAPLMRREFTDVYVDRRGRTLYAALNEGAGVLKTTSIGVGGRFISFVEAGLAWYGSSVERLVPWTDESYIYAITRLAPAPLVQIRTTPFEITGFY